MRYIASLLIVASLAGCLKADPPKPPVPPMPAVKPPVPKPLPPAPEIREPDPRPMVQVDRTDEILRRLDEIDRKIDELLRMRAVAAAALPEAAKKPDRKLLIFTASWCGPCHMQERDAVKPLQAGKGIRPDILGDPKRTSPVVLLEWIDFDARKDLVAKYGVTSLPTTIGLIDGKEVGRLKGAATKPDDLAKLVGVQ